MKASIITPTYGRTARLESLHRVFAAPSHEPKELLIYDDSPRPSEFCRQLDDPRVTCIYCSTNRTTQVRGATKSPAALQGSCAMFQGVRL